MAERMRDRKCRHCDSYLDNGDVIVICKDCGVPQHVSCLLARGRCAGFHCNGSMETPFVLWEDDEGQPLPETKEEQDRRQAKERRAEQQVQEYWRNVLRERQIIEEAERRRLHPAVKGVLITLLIVAVLVGGWFGIQQIICAEAEANAIGTVRQLDSARLALDSINPWAVGEARYQALQYSIASNCRKQKQYENAYTLFTELGTYRDSADQRKMLLMAWSDYLINKEGDSGIKRFKEVVQLTEEDYYWVFKAVDVGLDLVTDSKEWFDRGATFRVRNASRILDMLPKDYEHTWVLVEFLDILEDAWDYEDLFEDNADWMELMWSLQLVEKMAQQDDAMAWFMLGRWEDTWGEYYLEFTAQDDNTVYCSYNVPYPKEPDNVEYYDIRDCVYVWLDAESNYIMDVYRIKVVDYNNVIVTSCENGRSYSLRRLEE